MYRNKLTKALIKDDVIISDTEEGITLFDNGKWVFIQAKDLEHVQPNDMTSVAAQGTTEESSRITDVVTPADNLKLTNKIINYTYYFGLSEISACKKEYYNTCAYLSSPIDITIGRPVVLKALFSEGDNGSIEFNIIDGIEEIPILPDGVKEIYNEKLFYGLSPRFKANGDYSIYRDFIYIGTNMNDINFNENNIYTISYQPMSAAYTYKPKHDSIRIKAIMRMYDTNVAPPQINSMRVIEKEV